MSSNSCDLIIFWHHLVIRCCPWLYLPSFGTHSLILMDDLLSAILIKWLTQFQLLPLISVRISTTGTYSLWLYVWWHTDWNYDFLDTWSYACRKESLLDSLVFVKGRHTNKVHNTWKNFFYITYQHKGCSGSAPASLDSINWQHQLSKGQVGHWCFWRRQKHWVPSRRT